MAEDTVSLAFISRLGLENLRNPVLVESIKASLQGVGNQLDSTIASNAVIQEQSETTLLKESRRACPQAKDAINHHGTSGEHATASEVDILTYLVEADMSAEDHKADSSSDNTQIRAIELTLVIWDLVVKARDNTAWCTPLDDGQQQDGKIPWHGMPRLIALLVIAMAMEKRYATKKSIVIPVLVNHIKRSFRFSFQSAESNLCVIDHPEWAINYIRDVIRAYQTMFKRIKREVNSATEDLFAAYIPDETAIDNDKNGQRLKDHFAKLCTEFSHGSFFNDWTVSILMEVRLFVYSRLPLLVYDYRTKMPDAKLTVYEMANITNTCDADTKITAMRSFYDDEVKLNLMYNLIRAMTELSTTIRATDHNASFELFADFDKNTLIPCITLALDDESLKPKLQLSYDHGVVYGALDALISLENTAAINVVKNLVGDEGIMDSIRCDKDMQNKWYLHDDGYITQPMNILITLLKMLDERCKCLETSKSKSEFTTKVIVPVLNPYLEFVKAKWNAEDDVFKSCSLTAFLIESTTLLYEFLLKYPYTSYMPQVLASVEKVVNKMTHIMRDYINDIMEEPFSNIHERRLDVICYLKEKLLQMAVLCSLKTYKQIIKATFENVEKRLLAVLMPQHVQQIIFNNQTHVEMALQNCNLIYHELKVLTDIKYCPESMHIIEDIKTLLDTHPEDLITAVETIKTSIRIDSIFKDTNEILDSRHRNPEQQRVVLRTSSLAAKRISIQSGSIDVDTVKTMMEDVLEPEESDSDDSFTQGTRERQILKNEAVGEQLIIENVKQRLKVQKLNIQQIYTLSLHILYATLETWQFKELSN